MLKHKIPPIYLHHTRSSSNNNSNNNNNNNYNNDIILIESQPNHYHTVTKFLRNTHTISSLLDDTIIFAYCPSTAHPHHMLLLQRSIQPIFPTKDDNNDDDDDNEEEEEEKNDKNVEAKADKDDDDNSNNQQKGNSYQRIKIMDEWQKLLNFNLTG